VDFIQERVGDPALAALLLAKAAAGRERGVHVALSPDSRLPERAVPSEDLVTIVGNLIDNAFDALAGRGGGQIEVVLAMDGTEALLQVRDDGPGIAEPELARIFEAGWSTKGDGARRGLGLALVSAAAARLAGSAEAHNDGGAVLTVRVPAQTRATTAETP
jgi:two-component system, CitB family, sensor kinase